VFDLKNYFAMTGHTLDLDEGQYYTKEEKLDAINEMLSGAGDAYAPNQYTTDTTASDSDSAVKAGIDAAGTQYDVMKAITDTFPDIQPGVAGWLASYVEMPGTGQDPGQTYTKDQLVGLLDGTVSAGDLPLNALLANMTGDMIDNLAQHLGAEPGAFVNALEGLSHSGAEFTNETKMETLVNVLADEVEYKSDAEKFAELPYNDAYAFAESLGITGDALDGLSGAVYALKYAEGGDEQANAAKAMEIFTNNTLSHLNADDITKMAAQMSIGELKGMAIGIGMVP